MKIWLKYGIIFSVVFLLLYVSINFFAAQKCKIQKEEFAEQYGEANADKLMCAMPFPPRIKELFMPVFAGFIIGSVIGLLIGKVKKSN